MKKLRLININESSNPDFYKSLTNMEIALNGEKLKIIFTEFEPGGNVRLEFDNNSSSIIKESRVDDLANGVVTRTENGEMIIKIKRDK